MGPFENILQPVSSIFLTKPLLLLPDGHHPAALPEGDLQPGEEPLPSAARRRGQAVEQSHGPAGRCSHAVPLHRRRRSRGKRAVRKCAAGNVELIFFYKLYLFCCLSWFAGNFETKGKKNGISFSLGAQTVETLHKIENAQGFHVCDIPRLD